MKEIKEKEDYKKWITLIIIALVGFWVVNNFNLIGNIFSKITSILFPFILGGCIAFILNIPMSFFEKKLLKTKNKKNRKPNKRIRILSILFAVLVIILIIGLIIKLIVPELINIVKLLIDNIPYYTEQINNFINSTDLNSILQESNVDIEKIKNELINTLPGILTSSISAIGSIIGGVTDSFIAIVFAIYILIDKERLKAQAKKIIFAYFSKRKAYGIIYFGKVASNTFKKFFTVQCLEATILGTLCTIGLLVLRIPYAIPIGVLIGVTALIPIVGAFIGVFIGSILIISVNPIKVITFVIFVLILQQVEGNLIYPRVVGSSVGLPGMWVLAAVSVGGSLGGILGMLIGVPIASIVYTLLQKDVNKKVKKKEVIE